MKIQTINLGKICASIMIASILMVVGLLAISVRADAEVIRTGTVVNASSLNFRSGPGTEWPSIGYLSTGQSGRILEEGKATTGKVWYKMNVNGKIGWASSSYIKVTETVVNEDQTFDEYLASQGFPESYRPQLQALHAMYPNWVFEAQKTNLDWNTVIKEESKLGKNLVHSSADSSWKSTQTGAYNWETGMWVEIDSGGWVAASTEIIQHFMDPRNFLDSTNVFQFIKQSYNASALTEAQLAQKKTDLASMVKGTYLEKTCPGTERLYVDVIMEAAAESGVCPFTLASMMIQEQGINGTGRSISGTVSGYEGYYNYLNIGAYKTSTMSAVERGLWYAKGAGNGYTTYRRPWDNATDSIIGGSIYYGAGFVNVGQDTLYLKKFNVQGSSIYSHQYMTNVQGAASEGKHMAKAYDENARKSALVFKIPVYNNMPAKACQQPTGDGNPNYMLKSLAVTGYQLTPTFSMYETSYSLIVPNTVTSVTITAQALATTTTVSGTGAKTLNVGTNTATITTKAQNGSTRTYTITIVRQEASAPSTPSTPSVPETPVIPTPSISSTSYKVNSNNTVTGITSFPINVTEFAKKFAIKDGTVKVTTANGATKSGNVGTGDQVRVYDKSGALKFTYNVVIYGDTNGDGAVNALDLLRVQKQILGISKLSGFYGTAADTSKDGKTNALDLLQVQKQILKIGAIKQ